MLHLLADENFNRRIVRGLRAIEEVALVAECTDPADLDGQVLYLPL